ncbi:MAG: SDR family NAD(P)-dependent oxidoreductase, partial [Victivallaceae bacterium]
AASRIYIPCMGPYCASKAALAMFSNSLRVELRTKQVHVIDFCPGQINTGFSSRSSGELKPPDAPGRGSSSPEGLAASVYKAWGRRKAKSITYPRYIGPVMGILRGIFPGFYEKAVSKVWKLR